MIFETYFEIFSFFGKNNKNFYQRKYNSDGAFRFKYR